MRRSLLTPRLRRKMRDCVCAQCAPRRCEDARAVISARAAVQRDGDERRRRRRSYETQARVAYARWYAERQRKALAVMAAYRQREMST